MRALYVPHLAAHNLRALQAYRHRGEDRSLTYRYVLAPLYDRLLPLVPRHMAPNAITLVGFACTLSAHGALMWHAHAHAPPPPWANAFAALALLFYMTLDNLDGRQARRTRTSSPLGHFFDHSCDAVNVTLSAASVAVGLRMPLYKAALFIFCSQLGLAAHGLEELCTGAMVLREVNGPNEGILALVLAHAGAAALGVDACHRPMRALLGYTLVDGCLALCAAGGVGTVITCFFASRAGAGRRGVAHIVVAPLCYAALYAAWVVAAPARVDAHLVPIVWCTAAYFGDFLSRLLVAHLVDDPTMARTLTPAFACVTALPAAALCGPVYAALCTAGCIGVTLWRALCVVHQLCHFLDIHCLSIEVHSADNSKEKAS